jgi:hypothetical protein
LLAVIQIQKVLKSYGRKDGNKFSLILNVIRIIPETWKFVPGNNIFTVAFKGS